MNYKLLLVEDDPRLVRALSDLLGNRGYSVETATDGSQALEAGATRPFDLILLDVMLPKVNGLEVCAELRRRNIRAAVLMLTARTQVSDKVAGFKAGADDYLTKPFEMDELLVRIEALIRRSAVRPSAVYEFGGMTVNFDRAELVRSDRTVALSERESRLLQYFVEHRLEVVSRDRLLEQVWGYDTAPFTRTVDVHILRLRQKIEDNLKDPRFIVTVHGLGYRFNG